MAPVDGAINIWELGSIHSSHSKKSKNRKPASSSSRSKKSDLPAESVKTLPHSSQPSKRTLAKDVSSTLRELEVASTRYGLTFSAAVSDKDDTVSLLENYRNATYPADWPRPRWPQLQQMPDFPDIRRGLNGGWPDRRSPIHPDVKLVWPKRVISSDSMRRSAAEKQWRKQIGYDTLEFLKEREWETWQPNRLNLRYDVPARFKLPATVLYQTKIVCSSEDSMNAALRIIGESERPQPICTLEDIPLVLNMANEDFTGGGFLYGAESQEEDLCRRTDLFMALQSARYPLPKFGANYSFPVCILRDSKSSFYKFLQTSACPPTYFPQIGVLSAAASKPHDNYERQMKQKIDGLLSAALASGHRILVLGSWGCGATKIPPLVVANLFRALLEAKFKGRFKQVIFALSTHPEQDYVSSAFLAVFSTTLYRPASDINLDPEPNFIDMKKQPQRRPATVDEAAFHQLVEEKRNLQGGLKMWISPSKIATAVGLAPKKILRPGSEVILAPKGSISRSISSVGAVRRAKSLRNR